MTRLLKISSSSPDPTPRAAIYLRVSTKEQAEMGGEAEGYSIPAQREACRRKAQAIGAVVEEEFVTAARVPVPPIARSSNGSSPTSLNTRWTTLSSTRSIAWLEVDSTT